MSSPNKENSNTDTNPPEEVKKVGPVQVIGSVLAAMFGVQSDKNRERDFNSGNMSHFIFVGIVFVIIFIFTLIAIVNTILEEAGM
ncbi:MAG: DUF2970 domain-containing protein [Kangiellaceae bacterium]